MRKESVWCTSLYRIDQDFQLQPVSLQVQDLETKKAPKIKGDLQRKWGEVTTQALAARLA